MASKSPNNAFASSVAIYAANWAAGLIARSRSIARRSASSAQLKRGRWTASACPRRSKRRYAAWRQGDSAVAVAYGSRSFDQKPFADGGRTLADMLEDETTTAQIDQLELGDRM